MINSQLGSDRDEQLAQVVDEFFDAVAKGKTPEISDYLRRYPEIANHLKIVIPAMLATEHAASRSEPTSFHSTVPQEKQLGDFRILRQIGRGGMGVVYEAEQVSMKRRVALKVLPLAGLVDELKIHRFQNEVRAVAALNHPNIVPVYMVGQERGVHYYAMQLIHGRSLSDVISSLQRVRDHGEPLDGATISQITNIGRAEDAVDPRFVAAEESTQHDVDGYAPPAACETVAAEADGSTIPHSSRREYLRSVAALGIQAASALQHAHEQGVVHRDIKPANLLLDSSATLFVTDFGLARMESDVGVTMTGDLIGTLRYMAPEQALAKRVVVDHRADIYSLGVTLYELIALQPAYRAEDRQQLLKQIAFEEPTPLRRLDRDIPTELETIIHKAMSKGMDQRYASAQELADDLRSHLENRPIKARPPTTSEIIGKWTRRNATLTWAAIITLSLVTLTLAASTLVISRQLVRATKAEQAEKLARNNLTSRASELARHNYLLHVANADKALLEGRFELAQAELDLCEQEQRGWEWTYLANRTQAAFPLTLQASEQPIFTRDGKRLIAIGGLPGSPENRKVKIWDLNTRKVIHWLEHDSTITRIALSADENRIAGEDWHGNLFVWDIESGKTLWSVQVHDDDTRCEGLAFSPDDRNIASGSSDCKLVVVDAIGGEIKRRLGPFSGWTRKVTFSPDGRWITTGVKGEEPAQLINVTSGEIAATFDPGGGDQVPSFDPKSTRIFTGSQDGSIKVWNWDGEQLVEVDSWPDAGRNIKSLDVNRDGTRLVSTTQWPCLARVWDTTTGKELASLDTGDIVFWSAFSPDGDEVALYSPSGGIRFWRWERRDREDGMRASVLEGAVNAMFNADGDCILASTPMYFYPYTGPRHHFFQPEPAAILSLESAEKILRLDESVYEASWSPDGKQIVATSASDDEIQSYDAATGNRLWTLPVPEPMSTVSRVAPDSRRLITFSKRGTLRLMDFASGTEVAVHQIMHQGSVIAVSFSRKADLFALSLDFAIEIWDTRRVTRLSRHSFPGHFLKRLVFSEDGRHLYVGANGGLLMEINVATRKETKRFVGHVGTVLGIAVSPDGSHIVSGDNSSGQVVIWDVGTGRHLVTLTAHGEPITSLDWSSDGHRIVAGKEDGTVQIWTLPSSS